MSCHRSFCVSLKTAAGNATVCWPFWRIVEWKHGGRLQIEQNHSDQPETNNLIFGLRRAVRRSLETFTAGDDALRKVRYIASELPWACDPKFLAVFEDVCERLTQGAKPERLAYDEWMQHHAAYERIFARQVQHFVELVDDHLRKLATGVLAEHQGWAVIELDRIRDGEERPGACPHPEWLVVCSPVHHIAEAFLLQEVERRRALRNIWPEPAFGRLAGMSLDGVAALDDEPTLVLFPPPILALGIGAPVANEFVAAGQKRRRDLRARIQRRRVHIMRTGQVEFVQQIEQVP